MIFGPGISLENHSDTTYVVMSVSLVTTFLLIIHCAQPTITHFIQCSMRVFVAGRTEAQVFSQTPPSAEAQIDKHDTVPSNKKSCHDIHNEHDISEACCWDGEFGQITILWKIFFPPSYHRSWWTMVLHARVALLEVGTAWNVSMPLTWLDRSVVHSIIFHL